MILNPIQITDAIFTLDRLQSNINCSGHLMNIWGTWPKNFKYFYKLRSLFFAKLKINMCPSDFFIIIMVCDWTWPIGQVFNRFHAYNQPRSEGGAEGSVAPSKKIITNILKNFYEVFFTIDIWTMKPIRLNIEFPKPLFLQFRLDLSHLISNKNNAGWAWSPYQSCSL